MDELAAFKNPPKQLVQRESALLNIADLCFTGGPSLYNSKKERHANAHCFSSSVDAKHFQKAQDRSYSHPDQAGIAGPRLGFYGVIDERFDTELIREMAAARPDWQIVLVGPVVKIDPAHLPQAANIHYMGQRTYEELPQFLAGWDVCLLPFALNESTKFISPTKVLEYMAAELPSVSTPITDVKVPYGDVVAIAETPAEFIAACERMLNASEQKAALAERMRAIVANTSWDKTAAAMHKLIQTTEPGNKAQRLTADGNNFADGRRSGQCQRAAAQCSAQAAGCPGSRDRRRADQGPGRRLNRPDPALPVSAHAAMRGRFFAFMAKCADEYPAPPALRVADRPALYPRRQARQPQPLPVLHFPDLRGRDRPRRRRAHCRAVGDERLRKGGHGAHAVGAGPRRGAGRRRRHAGMARRSSSRRCAIPPSRPPRPSPKCRACCCARTR
jgi:hypothetical protein